MPEYHLDTHDDNDTWSTLDAFTQGYIEAMFFTENSPAFTYADIEEDRAAWEHAEREGQSDGTIPGDASFSDLAHDSLKRIIEDCREWQNANAKLLRVTLQWAERKGIAYDMERAGNDYWYTRNGHGVGFWDRGLGGLGDKLSDACRYREVDVYLGDDSKVHVS